MKQLKELLTLNRVDYKGCVEKRELLQRVVHLWVDTNLHNNDSKYILLIISHMLFPLSQNNKYVLIYTNTFLHISCKLF